MQPVALLAGDQLRVPFVDRDVDPGFQQALGQAEPAEPAAGHGHPKTAHCPFSDGGSSLRAGGGSSLRAGGGFGSRPYFCTSMTFSGGSDGPNDPAINCLASLAAWNRTACAGTAGSP